jgi:hypothetical protein
MECLFQAECHRGGEVWRDANYGIAFCGIRCQQRYYRVRERVDETPHFDAELFRELWLFHVALTRQVVIGAVYVEHVGRDVLEARVEQLLGNQRDLGLQLGHAAHSPAFGDAADRLLTEHIVQAKALLDEVLTEYQAEKELRVDALFVEWSKNGEQIADALAGQFAPMIDTAVRATLHHEMFRHLSLTKSEIVHTMLAARSKAAETAQQASVASVEFYTRIIECILRLASTLTTLIQH